MHVSTVPIHFFIRNEQFSILFSCGDPAASSAISLEKAIANTKLIQNALIAYFKEQEEEEVGKGYVPYKKKISNGSKSNRKEQEYNPMGQEWSSQSGLNKEEWVCTC